MDKFEQFSDAELAGKSYAELQALLADERLLMSDSDASNDLIFRIAAAMHTKENKTETQLEAERVRFWAGMVARYDDKIPVRLEDVVQNRKKLPAGSGGSTGRMHRRRFLSRNTLKRIAVAAALAVVVLVGNSLATYALNFNFLRIVVDFTDSLFVKTIIPAENTGNSPDTTEYVGFGDSGSFVAFQDALDAFGIVRPRIPERLPGEFAFDFFQVNERQDYVKISVQYKNGEKTVTGTIFSYTAVPETRTRHLEKSAGSPTVYVRSGIEFYLFDNMERTVATWTDGYVDCEIQGNVSDEEMKDIINYIYSEE